MSLLGTFSERTRELLAGAVCTFSNQRNAVRIQTMTAQPSLGEQVWEGMGVVASFRKLVGATDPLKAEPGTVRPLLANSV